MEWAIKSTKEGQEFTYYWSAPISRAVNSGVNKKGRSTHSRSEVDSQWDEELWISVIRMSIWVGTHGPTSGGYYTVHQEYGDPTDTTSPRIDLENIRGVNLRK